MRRRHVCAVFHVGGWNYFTVYYGADKDLTENLTGLISTYRLRLKDVNMAAILQCRNEVPFKLFIGLSGERGLLLRSFWEDLLKNHGLINLTRRIKAPIYRKLNQYYNM